MDPWKLKVDEESKLPVFTKPENEEEMPRPIYINPEGKEVALDPVGMYDKIIEMGKNEKELRGTAKNLKGQLELFADIEDVSAWKEEAEKALKTVADFNDKDWMDVKKVDALKADMNSAHEKQLKEIRDSFSVKEGEFGQTLEKKTKQIRKLMVSAKFATHPLFAGKNPKSTLPPEVAETYFGHHYEVEELENGELELKAFYDDGNPVYSHERPGELADFKEAMFSIFEKSPLKEQLVKGKESGSGAGGGSGEGEGDGDEISKLEKQYAEANAAKNVQLAIALKNKIHALRKKAA